MTYLMNEDPVALRHVAAAFRREGSLSSAELAGLAGLSTSLNYQGPLADKMREAINLAARVGAEQANALALAAARLDLEAARAELEQVARRAAGLP